MNWMGAAQDLSRGCEAWWRAGKQDDMTLAAGRVGSEGWGQKGDDRHWIGDNWGDFL